MQKLLSSNFQLGADASAAAGPVGRHASAGTDWKLDTEVLTYSRAKGLSQGSRWKVHRSARRRFPEGNLRSKSQLGFALGQGGGPSVAKPFLAEIRGAKAQAVAEGKAEAKEKDKQ